MHQDEQAQGEKAMDVAEATVSTGMNSTTDDCKAATAASSEPVWPSGTDIPIQNLLQIATPDYRSSEECLLSPDRLIFRLDDLLCSVCNQ